MQYAVLSFSYDQFADFEKQLAKRGRYSINLGDYMQTLAARHLLERLGVEKQQIVTLDRDRIASYRGPPVRVLMNACFEDWCFPLPEAIRPIFIGFQCGAEVIRKNRAYFKAFEPIGCRDVATELSFKEFGISALTTGCVTLTLPPRQTPPVDGKILCVYGTNVGAFCMDALKTIPEDMLNKVEFVFQRRYVSTYPMSAAEMHEAEAHAKRLLEYYRSEAALIVTPLHHAAAPAIASGIPVILSRNVPDSRFSFLQTMMPIYGNSPAGLRRKIRSSLAAVRDRYYLGRSARLEMTPLSQIDWGQPPLDVSAFRAAFDAHARQALARLDARPGKAAQHRPARFAGAPKTAAPAA